MSLEVQLRDWHLLKYSDHNHQKHELLLEENVVATLPRSAYQKQSLLTPNREKQVPILIGVACFGYHLQFENSSHFRDTHFMGTIITKPEGEKFTISSAVGVKR